MAVMFVVVEGFMIQVKLFNGGKLCQMARDFEKKITTYGLMFKIVSKNIVNYGG